LDKICIFINQNYVTLKIKELLTSLEEICPLDYQESYDNCGMLTGHRENEITGVLLCVDSTEEVLKEAVKYNCNVVIAHHPILFSGVKKITGKTYPERAIIYAIKNDLCIYAMHTNLDNIKTGVNHKIAEKIGLKNLFILSPKEGILRKLVTFCPVDKSEEVRSALFSAGAGNIGNYKECSFSIEGSGTFKAGENTHPYVGKKHTRHTEKEDKLEMIVSSSLQDKVIRALIKVHPYEEVAYEIYRLEMPHPEVGSGMIGEFEKPLTEKEFLTQLKKRMKLSCIRHTPFTGKKVKKVAICGGSGSFLLKDAIALHADVLVSADFKYHQFFDAEGELLIADIGHYESEQLTPEIVFELIKEKFTTFATRISKTNTNPVNYF
jgi:dinuclear metal center YbgI/SA1388 family protein